MKEEMKTISITWPELVETDRKIEKLREYCKRPLNEFVGFECYTGASYPSTDKDGDAIESRSTFELFHSLAAARIFINPYESQKAVIQVLSKVIEQLEYSPEIFKERKR